MTIFLFISAPACPPQSLLSGLVSKGGEIPQTPDGSFIAYVKWYAKEKGNARST